MAEMTLSALEFSLIVRSGAYVCTLHNVQLQHCRSWYVIIGIHAVLDTRPVDLCLRARSARTSKLRVCSGSLMSRAIPPRAANACLLAAVT